ncbi:MULTISPECIES: sensor histidine kinase [Streptacidiphilus]|uniref:histidine kinase n=1 Tax=Streptacidiphilus cavernicola TaxID=3342716 RepID=A0ABV6UMN1_9ACTN|nr:sensor histidine kinase [Streptacidiphilus jeojiense]
MALHARAATRQAEEDSTDGAGTGDEAPAAAAPRRGPARQLSLRTVLLILALVPTIAVVVLWAMNSVQLYDNWHTANDRNTVGKAGAAPIYAVFYNLQAERQLSAAAIADPNAYRKQLATQRQATDAAVASVQAVSATNPSSMITNFLTASPGVNQLAGFRSAMDKGTAGQQQTFDSYTAVIAHDLGLFNTYFDVNIADLATIGRPVMPAQWALEMISRESAIFTAGTVSGHFSSSQRIQIAQLVGAQQDLYNNQVIPLLPAQFATLYQGVLSGSGWKQKTAVENAVLTAPVDGSGRSDVPAQIGKQWQAALGGVAPRLNDLGSQFGAYNISISANRLDGLLSTLVTNSAVGGGAVLLVMLISIRLTWVLRRRIFALRDAAGDMQTRLPDLVDRLGRGETVDLDAELPEIDHGSDELGTLGQALNQARTTSLETAVRQAEQYRGFERLLQRIARRTQLLIGMQMKRLGEMERRHEDAEVLEGLFDLDHLAARLRRYEENLVILGGGQPQRRWRKPVMLLDVLRSAQGEVQDYRRIRIETEGQSLLSERAVGPMVHVLAELMENAVTFSKPPSPVEVSAARVGRGLAIEIEDRGMGMDPEQYAEANQLMVAPPRMDVISRADDARLGLYVVARLAANLGLKVELRPSSFGGTRVVVLIPPELIAEERRPVQEAPNGYPPPPAQLSVIEDPGSGPAGSDYLDDPYGGPGSTGSGEPVGPHAYPAEHEEVFARPLIGPWIEPSAPAAAATAPKRLEPLPKRVRQASLAAGLQEPPPRYDDDGPYAASAAQPLPRRGEPRRSGAAVGAFQRQSRLARLATDPDHHPTHPSPGHDRTRKEDGR